MIEYDIGAPRNLAMTGFAAALDLTAVRVFAAMAARTVLGKLLCIHRRGVADVTVDLGVRARQCELGLRGVVVSHRLPSVIVMAIVALDTEAEGVSIVRLMAAVAILRDLVLVVTTAVA